MNKLLWSLSAAGAILLQSAGAWSGEVSPELQAVVRDAEPLDRVAVIIELAKDASLRDFRRFASREVRRREIVRQLKKEGLAAETDWREYLEYLGGRKFKNLWIRGALAIEVPAYLVEPLSRWSGVATIRLDAQFSAPEVTFQSSSLPEWNIEGVGAPAVWQQGTDGTGAVVALVDSGVDPYHLDLSARWRGGANSWYDPHGQHAQPHDANGHGTEVLGIIVGGDATGSAIGMAPGARWIAAKLFDDAGKSSLSAIDLSFQWILDPDGNPNTDDAPDVVNNSWNLTNTVSSCDPILQDNIQTLRDAGIAVVFAAGNEAGVNESPANYATTAAVGSVDETWTISSFSARGPSSCDLGIFPTLVAPGDGIKTSTLTYGMVPDNFGWVGGTSFSAPHVTGAVALLRSAAPELTVDQIEALLRDNARDLGSVGPDNTYGYGLLDVAAAYAQIETPVANDADGDGSLVGQDCNDADASIYPGAPEVRRDGIDQDCNRYDLTLRIALADYAGDKLTVYATTAYGDYKSTALPDPGSVPVLAVRMGDGSSRSWPMSWAANKQRWQKTVSRIARWGGPQEVSVSAPEGTAEYTLGASPSGADAPTIVKAQFEVAKDQLVIVADSVFGDQAYLGYVVTLANGSIKSGDLTWNAGSGDWRKTLRGFGPNLPMSVTVFGIDGEATAAVTITRPKVIAGRNGRVG